MGANGLLQSSTDRSDATAQGGVDCQQGLPAFGAPDSESNRQTGWAFPPLGESPATGSHKAPRESKIAPVLQGSEGNFFRRAFSPGFLLIRVGGEVPIWFQRGPGRGTPQKPSGFPPLCLRSSWGSPWVPGRPKLSAVLFFFSGLAGLFVSVFYATTHGQRSAPSARGFGVVSPVYTAAALLPHCLTVFHVSRVNSLGRIFDEGSG